MIDTTPATVSGGAMALLWEFVVLDVLALGVTGGLVRRTGGRSFGPGFLLGSILAVLVLAVVV